MEDVHESINAEEKHMSSTTTKVIRSVDEIVDKFGDADLTKGATKDPVQKKILGGCGDNKTKSVALTTKVNKTSGRMVEPANGLKWKENIRNEKFIESSELSRENSENQDINMLRTSSVKR